MNFPDRASMTRTSTISLAARQSRYRNKAAPAIIRTTTAAASHRTTAREPFDDASDCGTAGGAIPGRRRSLEKYITVRTTAIVNNTLVSMNSDTNTRQSGPLACWSSHSEAHDAPGIPGQSQRSFAIISNPHGAEHPASNPAYSGCETESKWNPADRSGSKRQARALIACGKGYYRDTKQSNE